MPERIKFSPEALAIVTPAQCKRIAEFSNQGRNSIEVLTAWDLPKGFVSFTLTYEAGSTIYGGIDPAGVAST